MQIIWQDSDLCCSYSISNNKCHKIIINTMKAALKVGTWDWCHPMMKLREGWGTGHSMQTEPKQPPLWKIQKLKMKMERIITQIVVWLGPMMESKRQIQKTVTFMPPALSHDNKSILREGASCRWFTSRTQGLAHPQRAPATDLAHTSLLKQMQEVQWGQECLWSALQTPAWTTIPNFKGTLRKASQNHRPFAHW